MISRCYVPIARCTLTGKVFLDADISVAVTPASLEHLDAFVLQAYVAEPVCIAGVISWGLPVLVESDFSPPPEKVFLMV